MSFADVVYCIGAALWLYAGYQVVTKKMPKTFMDRIMLACGCAMIAVFIVIMQFRFG